MVDPHSETSAARDLIRRCLTGDGEAAVQFQQCYGELIYGYPLRVYRTPPEDAGDFYVFAFEQGRIFRRLRTFEGRTSLRAYLLGFVLDNLVLEWKRGAHEIETVSIETVSELADSNGPPYPPGDDASTPTARPALDAVLAQMEPPKAVLLKLLYIEDCELNAAELRYLAKVSGRRVPDVLATIDRLRCTVREREAGLRRVEDALEGVHAWIQLYERRVRRIADDLSTLPPDSSAAARLRDEQAQLERKIKWRQRQRTTLLERAQRRKVTAPYKDIAALLSTTVGNVASQILRLRKELAAQTGERREAPDAGGDE